MTQPNTKTIQDLEIPHSELSQFFSMVFAIGGKIWNHCVLLDLKDAPLNFIPLNNDFLSTCGSLSFSTEKLNLIQFVTHNDENSLLLCFKDGMILKLILENELDEDFKNFIHAVSSDAKSSFDVNAMNKVCPCCKAREDLIIKNTAIHPVSIIIQRAVKRRQNIAIELPSGSVKHALYTTPSSMKFSEGIALIEAEQAIELPILKIHSIHIKNTTIDDQEYSQLSVYNSHAHHLFNFCKTTELGVKDHV